MSEEIQEMQRQIVEAVQQELTRFSSEVATNLKTLRDEVSQGAAARTELENRVASLTTSLEAIRTSNTQSQNEMQQVLESRLGEFGTAIAARHDEMSERLAGVAGSGPADVTAAVESATKPLLDQVTSRQGVLEAEVRNLDGSIRKFDAQAGEMVKHINQVTGAIDVRLEKIQSDVRNSVDDQMSDMVVRIDDVVAAASRQQAEVSSIVGDRVDASEVRINERMVGLETRVNDDIGKRVAEIDGQVTRMGAGLESAATTLGDQIRSAETRFEELESSITQMRSQMENIDEEAIDEMKDKISSALGQAELVRIEMERYQETIDESLEKTAVRLTEIETTVQDQSMDVATAVQLERLEEVERAVLMLDPDIIRDSSTGDDSDGEDTVAMTRPAASADSYEPAQASSVLAAGGHLDAPASAPLSPPTADLGTNVEPVAQDSAGSNAPGADTAHINTAHIDAAQLEPAMHADGSADPAPARPALNLSMSLDPPAGS